MAGCSLLTAIARRRSTGAASAWVERFVRWYNAEHLHSGVDFVTPNDRHAARDQRVLDARRALYARARGRHPERWTREIRNWSPSGPVHLNPNPITAVPPMKQAA